MPETTQTIEPQGTFKVQHSGSTHFPVLLTNELGTKLISFVCTPRIAILYNPDDTLNEILKRIDLLKANLKLRIKETIT